MAEDEFEEISELPEYSPKSDFSKALKVSEAFSKVIEARAKEMKPGYFNYSFDKYGNAQKLWVADARVVFFGAVEALRSLLGPEITRDNSNKIEEIYEEIEELEESYSYEEHILDYKDNGCGSKVAIYKNTGSKIMPEIGDEVIVPVENNGENITYGPVKGGWDKRVNTYRNLLVKKYDNIFLELSNIVDRLNYFKQGMSF